MTIREFYETVGADYDDVLRRLTSERLIAKYLKKMPADPSFELLTQKLGEGDLAEAFRAAHTLKGLCMTLNLGHLSVSSSELTEELRNSPDPARVEELYGQVKKDYTEVMDGIQRID